MHVILFIISYTIAIIPSFILVFVARVLSLAFYDVIKLRRRLVDGNIRTAFPDLSEEKVQHIGRQSFYHLILTFFEFMKSPLVDIKRGVSLSGEEHFQGSLAKGQGAYIICCHIGNWEAMGGALSTLFTPTHVVVKKVGGPALNSFVEKLREYNHFLGIKRKKKGDVHRTIQSALSRGEAVGFVMDQSRPGEPRLDFFNKPALTNTSFAAIWQKNPAPIVPSFITRDSFGKHTLHFLPSLEMASTDNLEQDIIEHSKKFNKVVEKMIRACPEQYFWLHNRWK